MQSLSSHLKSYRRALKNRIRHWRDHRRLAALAACPLVGVTYANNGNTDGAGAQLLRIYAIYALSRLLRVNYVHTPLARLDYQGLQALETQKKDDGIVDIYNRIFSIPSDCDLPQDYECVELQDVHLNDLIRLRKKAQQNNRFILVRILYPYKITDRQPGAYGCLAKVTPFQTQASLPLRIALHVRRGDLFFAAPERLIGNQYYITIARNISAVLNQMRLAHVFELYTEIPTRAFTVTAAGYGLGNMVTSDVHIVPDQDEMRDFEVLPNLHTFINTDPVETLQRLATAHILVTSRSAFSYLAGLLNPDGVTIYYPFLHPPMPHWLVADDSGMFSETAFREQMQNLAHSLKEKAQSTKDFGIENVMTKSNI
jgi:hypothetical protein